MNIGDIKVERQRESKTAMNKSSFVFVSSLFLVGGMFLLVTGGKFIFIDNSKLGLIVIVIGLFGLWLAGVLNLRNWRNLFLRLRSDTITKQRLTKPAIVVRRAEKIRKRYKIFGERELYRYFSIRFKGGKTVYDMPVSDELFKQLKKGDAVEVTAKIYRDKNGEILKNGKEFLELRKPKEDSKPKDKAAEAKPAEKPAEKAEDAEKSADT